MKDLTVGNEFKVIFLFAIPMLIGNLFQQLYNTVDSIIVGNYLGKVALGAVGASFPVVFFMLSFVTGIGNGASVMVSQYYGAKQLHKLKETVETFYFLLAAVSILVTAAGILSAGSILTLMNTPAEMYADAKSYMTIFIAGIVFLFGFNGFTSILSGLGDSKTPLYFLSIATVINILLDLLFVPVLKMGVNGAAYATVISEALTFFGGLVYLQKKHPLLRINIRTMRFDPKICGQILRIGFPTGVQQMLIALSVMSLMGVVMSFGTDVQTGFTSAGRIDSLAFMPVISFSIALSSFAGQNIGAGRMDRAIRGFRMTLLFCIGFAMLIGTVFVLFGPALVSMFNQEPNVIYHGAQMLKTAGPFYWVVTIMLLVNAVMRGAGATMVPMFISLVALWLFRVPFAMWLSSLMGSDGIWWAFPLGWSFGSVASLIYYLTGLWKKKPLTAPEFPIPPYPGTIPENSSDMD
ncbi:MAG: MATE family efflux transporter [Brevinematales bacterium]|nr:MATE family efflux transporter [Brevinematales bacterium]